MVGKQRKIMFTSDLVCSNKECFTCKKPCELMKRKDVQRIMNGRSTGIARWDKLLDKINGEEVCIAYADLCSNQFVLKGWFKTKTHMFFNCVFDFDISFDIKARCGYVTIGVIE